MDDLQSSEEVKWESWETERGRREGFVPPGCLQLNDKLPCGHLYQLAEWGISVTYVIFLLFRPLLWWMRSNK